MTIEIRHLRYFASIVAHGNIIRYFAMRALQAPPEFWINMDIAQCGLSVVNVFADGRMLLQAHNDTGHLPPTLLRLAYL